MQKLKYLVFLLFNLAYKDGNYDESQEPYFSSVIAVVAFQYVILLIAFFFLDKFIMISEYFILIHPKLIIVFFLALLVLVNYYFLVKNKYFNIIYKEFKNAPINTRRNRRISYACLILYWVVIFVVIANLKSWFSL